MISAAKAATSSGTDTTTLVIAVVGLALAAASLAWQTATFALTGSRVRADILRGAIGRGGLVSSPPEKWNANSPAALAAQGFTEPVVAVEVRNVGRMAVSVQKVTAYLDNGIGFSPTQTETPLPFRLEPGSSEKWWVEAAVLHAAIVASRHAGIGGSDHPRVHVAVGLGTGKVVKTKSMPF
jgi:hypothetical protein